MPGNPLVRFDEGRVGRTARCRPLSYSTERLFFQSIDDTGDAVLDQRSVEVDQQAKSLIGQPKIGQKLLFVHRRENLNRLDLDDQQILDDQVSSEPDVEPNRSVDHRNCLLADCSESTLSEFIGEHRVVWNPIQEMAGPRVVWMRKAASTTSLAMAFSVMTAFYIVLPRRQDAKNARRDRGYNRGMAAGWHASARRGRERSITLQPAAPQQTRPQEIAVHQRDDFQLDILRAHRFAFADVGAASEQLAIGLSLHRDNPPFAFRLPLRQQAQVGHLGPHEQRSRSVRTHRHARAAADARGRVHGAVGILFGHQDGVTIRRAASRNRDEAAGRDQPVEGAAIDHQIASPPGRPSRATAPGIAPRRP